jgi:hypothetical protein
MPPKAVRKLHQHEETTVPDRITEIIEELAIANRILGHEGVIDAFGHVSIRHPDDPKRYRRFSSSRTTSSNTRSNPSR